jgi:hypothetical protein
MANDQYTRVALDENEKYEAPFHENDRKWSVRTILVVLVIATLCFAMGFGIGENWSSKSILRPQKEVVPGPNGLLDPQSFIPESECSKISHSLLKLRRR